MKNLAAIVIGLSLSGTAVADGSASFNEHMPYHVCRDSAERVVQSHIRVSGRKLWDVDGSAQFKRCVAYEINDILREKGTQVRVGYDSKTNRLKWYRIETV